MSAHTPVLAQVPCAKGRRLHISWGTGDQLLLSPIAGAQGASKEEHEPVQTTSTVKWYKISKLKSITWFRLVLMCIETKQALLFEVAMILIAGTHWRHQRGELLMIRSHHSRPCTQSAMLVRHLCHLPHIIRVCMTASCSY